MFPNLDGAALVASLDRKGVRCSQTSACTSSRPEPSHVLMAMGLTENEAFSSVRFSFSGQNNLGEVDLAVSALLSTLEQLTSNDVGNFSDVGMIKHEV